MSCWENKQSENGNWGPISDRVVRNGLSEKVICSLSPEGFNGVSHERCRGKTGSGREEIWAEPPCLGKTLHIWRSKKQTRISGAQWAKRRGGKASKDCHTVLFRLWQDICAWLWVQQNTTSVISNRRPWPDLCFKNVTVVRRMNWRGPRVDARRLLLYSQGKI